MTRLNDEQLEHFHQEGYVVVEDVIDPEELLDPLEAEYGTVLTTLPGSCTTRELSDRHTPGWNSASV